MSMRIQSSRLERHSPVNACAPLPPLPFAAHRPPNSAGLSPTVAPNKIYKLQIFNLVFFFFFFISPSLNRSLSKLTHRDVSSGMSLLQLWEKVPGRILLFTEKNMRKRAAIKALRLTSVPWPPLAMTMPCLPLHSPVEAKCVTSCPSPPLEPL